MPSTSRLRRPIDERGLDKHYSFVPASNEYSHEADEVENDIEMFNNAIHITNLDQVDHDGLLKRMHERFKDKMTRWEKLARRYSRIHFCMTFSILLIQILQMIIQQAASIWLDERILAMPKVQPRTGVFGMIKTKVLTPSQSSYMYAMEKLFTPQALQTMHSLLIAITAVIAGLQMMLKLDDRAERYKRGAKIYGRLLRMSTYYIMMVESGGKIDDVTGLWREALKKEGKWVPVTQSSQYIP